MTRFEQISVAEARRAERIGELVRLQGWIRTRRDSKGFSFLEVNDGTCMANIQVIADDSLPNYADEVKRLSAGCSVTIEGSVMIKNSQNSPAVIKKGTVIDQDLIF